MRLGTPHSLPCDASLQCTRPLRKHSSIHSTTQRWQNSNVFERRSRQGLPSPGWTPWTPRQQRSKTPLPNSSDGSSKRCNWCQNSLDSGVDPSRRTQTSRPCLLGPRVLHAIQPDGLASTSSSSAGPDHTEADPSQRLSAFWFRAGVLWRPGGCRGASCLRSVFLRRRGRGIRSGPLGRPRRPVCGWIRCWPCAIVRTLARWSHVGLP